MEYYLLIIVFLIMFLIYLRYRTNKGVYQLIAALLVFYLAKEYVAYIEVVLALSILGFYLVYEAMYNK